MLQPEFAPFPIIGHSLADLCGLGKCQLKAKEILDILLLRIQDKVREHSTEAELGGLLEELFDNATVYEDLNELTNEEAKEETQPEEEDYEGRYMDWGFLDMLESDMIWREKFKISGDFRDSAIVYGKYILTRPIYCHEGFRTKDSISVMKP